MFFTSTRPAWPRAAGLLNAAALAVLPAFAGQGRGRGLPPQPAQPVAGLVPGNQLPAPIQVPILQQLDPEFLASLAVVNLGVPEKIEAYREALRNGLQQQGAAEPPAPQMVPMPAPPGGNQVPAAAANQQELPWRMRSRRATPRPRWRPPPWCSASSSCPWRTRSWPGPWPSGGASCSRPWARRCMSGCCRSTRRRPGQRTRTTDADAQGPSGAAFPRPPVPGPTRGIRLEGTDFPSHDFMNH